VNSPTRVPRGGCRRVAARPHPGERGRVLHLQPIARAARAIGRAEPLRHDAFTAELAGVAEKGVREELAR
jgi:hypothetical protein